MPTANLDAIDRHLDNQSASLASLVSIHELHRHLDIQDLRAGRHSTAPPPLSLKATTLEDLVVLQQVPISTLSSPNKNDALRDHLPPAVGAVPTSSIINDHVQVSPCSFASPVVLHPPTTPTVGYFVLENALSAHIDTDTHAPTSSSLLGRPLTSSIQADTSSDANHPAGVFPSPNQPLEEGTYAPCHPVPPLQFRIDVDHLLSSQPPLQHSITRSLPAHPIIVITHPSGTKPRPSSFALLDFALPSPRSTKYAPRTVS